MGAAAVCELSSLDNWMMLQLLDRMPLGSLLCLGRTSSRFKRLVEWHLSGRRQLSLVIGLARRYDPGSYDVFNSITVARLDRQAVERILALIPNIASLEILNHSSSSDDELLYLFEGWADQLVELEVLLFEKIQPRFTALPLFGLINRMHQLKELGIMFHGRLVDTDWTSLHLPVISQLRSFAFGNSNDAGQMMRQLLAHGTNRLTYVRLCCPFRNLESGTLLLDAEPHLAASFVTLNLERAAVISFRHLVTICRQYRSIDKLAIPLDLLTVAQLNRAMAMLPRLTTVHIEADFPSRRTRRQAEEAAMILGEEVEPDTVDSSQLVPVLRVTRLRLHLNLASHADFDILHLDTLFPSLVDLRFLTMSCDTCGYDSTDGDLETTRRCLQQLQSKTAFGEMFPELLKVTFSGHDFPETLHKEDWQPMLTNASIDLFSGQ